MPIDKWKDTPWKCKNCEFMLGVVSSDQTVLRIKWRDLYITIEDAESVKVVCRRCGRENVLSGVKVCPQCGFVGGKPEDDGQSKFTGEVQVSAQVPRR